MKKLLLVMISFLGFSSVTMAQAAETQESAAKLEAQQATQQAVPTKFGKANVVNNQQSEKAKAKAQAASPVPPSAKTLAEIKLARKADALPKKAASLTPAPSIAPNN